jgi:hypothetical protein
MQYMLLIYFTEADYKLRNDEQNGAITREYMTYTQTIRESGHLVGADRLGSVTTATTLREKDGKLLKTDGPFAETREQLGGYYIIEAKNLDEAVSVAARMPGVRFGAIEIRPIMAMPAQS